MFLSFGNVKRKSPFVLMGWIELAYVHLKDIYFTRGKFRINFCEKLEPHAEICLRDYRPYLFHVNIFILMKFIVTACVLTFIWISEQWLLPYNREGGYLLRGAKLYFKWNRLLVE